MSHLSSTTNFSDDSPQIKWVKKLFGNMALEYGSNFVHQWGMNDADQMHRHWANRLAEMGMTITELERGCNALKTRQRPPNLPEFVLMCRPPIDPVAAYYEASAGLQERDYGRMGDWSSPAVFWAAAGMQHDLRNQTHVQVKTRWEGALRKSIEKGQWEPIPKPVLAIANNVTLSRDGAAKMLGKLEGGEVLKPKADHAMWYKRILKRVADGDKTVSMAQKNFALEAAKAHGFDCSQAE